MKCHVQGRRRGQSAVDQPAVDAVSREEMEVEKVTVVNQAGPGAVACCDEATVSHCKLSSNGGGTFWHHSEGGRQVPLTLSEVGVEVLRVVVTAAGWAGGP